MKLTIRQVRELAAAIDTGLAGRARVARVNNADQVVVEPFSFDGDAMLALAINLNELKPHLQKYEQTYRTLFAAASKGQGKVEPGTPEMEQMTAGEAALLDQDIEVKLQKVELSALKPNDNKLSPGIISRLMPVLVFKPPSDADK